MLTTALYQASQQDEKILEVFSNCCKADVTPNLLTGCRTTCNEPGFFCNIEIYTGSVS